MSSGKSRASARGVSEGAADAREDVELVASAVELGNERAEAGPVRDHIVGVRQEGRRPMRRHPTPSRTWRATGRSAGRTPGHHVREAGVDRRRLFRARSCADRVALHERDPRIDRVGQRARWVALESSFLHDAPRSGRVLRRERDVTELESDDRELRMRDRPRDRDRPSLDPRTRRRVGRRAMPTPDPAAQEGEPREQRRVGAPGADVGEAARRPARNRRASARRRRAPSWRGAWRGSPRSLDPRHRCHQRAAPHRSIVPPRRDAVPPHGATHRSGPRSGTFRVPRGRRTTLSRH